MILHAELNRLLALASEEDECAIPFLTVTEYAEDHLGGWTGPGQCEYCGEDVSEVTKFAKYCKSCVHDNWIESRGEFRSLVTLARSLYRGFSPLWEYPALLEDSEDDPR